MLSSLCRLILRTVFPTPPSASSRRPRVKPRWAVWSVTLVMSVNNSTFFPFFFSEDFLLFKIQSQKLHVRIIKSTLRCRTRYLENWLKKKLEIILMVSGGWIPTFGRWPLHWTDMSTSCTRHRIINPAYKNCSKMKISVLLWQCFKEF